MGDLKEGLRIFGIWKGGNIWYPGKIVKIDFSLERILMKTVIIQRQEYINVSSLQVFFLNIKLTI